MEQIEKALARARELRAGNLAGLRPVGPAANEQPAKTANGMTPHYSETLVVRGDARRMVKERLVADKSKHPAADIYGVGAFTERKHWGCTGPLVIDARIKPHHAPPLAADPEVAKKIDALAARGGALAKWL